VAAVSRISRRIQTELILLLAAVLLPVQTRAANLKAETVAASDKYLQSVNGTLQDRTRPGGRFLWPYEQSERPSPSQF